jgi:hypothetical protein
MSDTEKSTQTEDLNDNVILKSAPPPEPVVKIRKPRAKKYPTNKEYNIRYYHDVLKQQEKKNVNFAVIYLYVVVAYIAIRGDRLSA